MSLNFGPWSQLTQEERKDWEDAAEEKGPHFIGGLTFTGQEFHDHLVEERMRKERQTKHTY